ncbi:activin receptor type II, putative, partial [Ixodes scapularis]
NGSEECKPGENEKGNLCYVLWQNTSGSLSIKLKGCWVGNNHECSRSEHCAETKREPGVQLLFCCCEGDLCNSHLKPSAKLTPAQSRECPVQPHGTVLACSLGPVVGMAGLLLAAWWVWQRRKLHHAPFAQVPTAEPTPLPSPLVPPRSLQLIEVKAQGRFGAVWKARYGSQYVAVKIFPPQDKNSWAVEKDMYKLPQMKHENVLAFLGASKNGDNLHVEYWLVTEYHERGSLSDHLKVQLPFPFCSSYRVFPAAYAASALRRAETPFRVHRPVMSGKAIDKRNIFSKYKVLDFSFLDTFLSTSLLACCMHKVGTRRYMAPEVLEGAINFSLDAFLRIDMYACALVLWELVPTLVRRTGPVDEYMLPFEEEVGQHPTLEDMQEAVVNKKVRPRIKDHWRKHQGLALLGDTIEECWDHDAEARLSASCVEERISFLYKTVPPTPSGEPPLRCSAATSVLLPPKESSI